MSSRCREDLPSIWEWFRDHPGFMVVVGMPSWMSGRGWEALPDIQEWSGDPPGCL